MGENLSALEFTQDFLARTRKNEPLKNKINKLDYIEICICSSKATAKKIKEWPLARKKIFADIYPIKALYPNIRRALSTQ